MSDLIVILTTMPDDDRARDLARMLVEERLAACVNVHSSMISTYRWKDAVEVEPERQIVIKTTRGRLAAIETRLLALHPYRAAGVRRHRRIGGRRLRRLGQRRDGLISCAPGRLQTRGVLRHRCPCATA